MKRGIWRESIPRLATNKTGNQARQATQSRVGKCYKPCRDSYIEYTVIYCFHGLIRTTNASLTSSKGTVNLWSLCSADL